MQKFRSILIILLSALLLSGCGVEIYDLQPVLPTEITPTAIRTVTQVVRQDQGAIGALFTATPPIHLAPTSITERTAIEILDVTMINGGVGWAWRE